jgi:hypothetical protein
MPAPNELPLFAVSLKHGYYSREAKAERSRVRAAILRSAICATRSKAPCQASELTAR